MAAVSRYSFAELSASALSSDATQTDINRLGEWMSEFGQDSWNGECFDVCGRSLYPLYRADVDCEDSLEVVGYTFDQSESIASLSRKS